MYKFKQLKFSVISSILLHAFFIASLSICDLSLDKHLKTHYSQILGQVSSKASFKLVQIQSKPKVVETNKNSHKPKKKKKVIPKKAPQINSSTKGLASIGQKNKIALYLKKVRIKIVKHKFKSRLAKKLRLKGKVKIKFELVWPNKVKNIQIIGASRYLALDNSAIETIHKIENMPHFPSDIDDKLIPITLSMVFE